MAITTTVNINDYVTDIIGEGAVVISDETMMAGMEDVVRKIETLAPEMMREFEVETALSSVPVTLHAAGVGVRVYKNNEIVIPRPDKQHISNPMSLMHDRGETAYYYIVGDKLYVTPFKPTMFNYTLIGVAYGVLHGTVTFPRRLRYPLALYCAQIEAYKRYRSAVGVVTDDINTLPSIQVPQQDLALLQARITADDAEMAQAQLAKIRLGIEATSAQAGIDSLRIQRIQARIEYANSMLTKYLVTKAAYDSYFGLVQAQGETK